MAEDGNKGPRREKKPDDSWAQASLAITIPGLLFAGPVVGFLLADLLQRKTGCGDWVIFVGILLGIVSGSYETYKIIRRLD